MKPENKVEIPQYDYFYGEETLQFTFYRIPKQLIRLPEFKHLSNDAKLLYGLFLDRSCLSATNHWISDDNRVYIIYTLENIMDDMCIGRAKAVKLLKELSEAGLVEKKRQGLGLPSLLFLKSCFKPLKFSNDTSGSMENELLEVSKRNFKEFSEGTSGSMQEKLLEVSNSNSNNTNPNNLNDNNTYLSYQKTLPMEKIDAYVKLIAENISYSADRFHDEEDQQTFTTLYHVMCDVVLSDKETIRVNATDFPSQIVKSVFFKLTFEHIQYVMESLKRTTTRVRNMRNYLISSLYNSYLTLEQYYQQEFRHDNQNP